MIVVVNRLPPPWFELRISRLPEKVVIPLDRPGPPVSSNLGLELRLHPSQSNLCFVQQGHRNLKLSVLIRKVPVLFYL